MNPENRDGIPIKESLGGDLISNLAGLEEARKGIFAVSKYRRRLYSVSRFILLVLRFNFKEKKKHISLDVVSTRFLET